MNIQTTPKDSMIILNGSHYKIGLRNLVFIFVGDEWIRSGREEHEIINAIRLNR